jgi:hypothetical protein
LDQSYQPFAPLLKRIEPNRFSEFALSAQQAFSLGDKTITCQTQLPPLCGSYNLTYKLCFSDGVSWVMRTPISMKDGEYDSPQVRSVDSEVATITYIRQNTTIPEIYAWASTDDDEFNHGMPTGTEIQR